jgi:anti-anti-sigma regulatory factor
MNTIELEEILDISHAANIYEQLKGIGVAADSYRLNGDKVEHVDTAGVQLLLAFIKSVQGNGGQIQWQGLSDKLRASIEHLGLAREIGVEPR